MTAKSAPAPRSSRPSRAVDDETSAPSSAAEQVAISIRVVDGMAAFSPSEWDACAAPETLGPGGGRPQNPFLTHRFLSALEESGSATAKTGWAPQHLRAELEDGALLGVMPLYVKNHSQGEYVFDHGWADAFMRAGGDYYPKLQCAVPFTPATGRRVLARADAPLATETIEAALLQGAAQITAQNGLSSLHITFCTEAEYQRFGALGFLQRQDQQFHWEARGCADFAAFLDSLASRKRKQLRKEREKAVENGIEIRLLTGDAIEEEHWDAFWGFYQDTGARKWGRPYLSRAFFDCVQRDMRDDVALVMCRREGRWIAGALNFIGRETLYGRYWGCVEDHPFLHFEACYYQAIDAAFALGLTRVEAGAQGAHKLARGYVPTPTYSAHWIAHPGLREAVARYLDHERAAVEAEIAALAAHTPFKKG